MSQYSDRILADVPECYWRLGTSLTDLSGNGHTPVLSAAPPSDVAGLLAGDSDGAKGFDGAAAQSVSDAAYRPVIAGASRTIEIWWSNTKTGAVATVPWYVFSGASYTCLQVVHSTGNIALYVEGVSQGSWGAPMVPVGAFGATHLVVTMDDPNNVAELFVNGVSKGTITMGTAWAAAGATVSCIVAGFTGQLVQGVEDEFAIYNRILTPAEIRTHYAIGAGTANMLLKGLG